MLALNDSIIGNRYTVSSLQPGQVAPTVFTTPVGRVVDLTFGRLAKRLIVLQVANVVETAPIAGDKVWADGAEVGRVTSVAPLVESGMVKALAFVKGAAAKAGRELTVVDGGTERVATVLSVPGEG